MGTRYLYQRVNTSLPPAKVQEIAAQIFRSSGGMVHLKSTGILVINGKTGTSFGFTANFTANLVMTQVNENSYDLQLYMSWGWSDLMWVFLLIGFLLGGLPWLFIILYFVFDPQSLYQQLLNQLQITLQQTA